MYYTELNKESKQKHNFKKCRQAVNTNDGIEKSIDGQIGLLKTSFDSQHTWENQNFKESLEPIWQKLTLLKSEYKQ